MKPTYVRQGISAPVKEATSLSHSLFSIMLTLHNLLKMFKNDSESGMEMAAQNLVDAAEQ
jgi:hypothetical protein